ncbi:MAG: putative Ig domain-containing protein [Prevotellaceae bacterium]|jgi:gliding motility-associated-like protein|nr:putative Ig domain-containing protein [Prevotellaceae bacterium]
MKNYICLLFLLFFYAHTAFGQYTTEGRDFWVSFGNNYNESSYNLILQIRVVAAEKTDVRFTFTELLNIPETITLEAGTVYTRDLSYSEKTAVHSNYSGTTRKSLRIQSDKNVSVYAINLYKNTTDATIVLPVTSLGNSYYHMSYPSLYADGYTLVAIDDNTDIYEDGTLLTTLNTGGVYSRYISSQDLTGKQITSNNPIAYFTTNSCVNIPKDIGYCDCLYEQLFPVALWGTTFMVPVTIRGKERIRIMASQDGTTVVLTGGSIMSTPGKGSLNLNKGEFVEVEIKASEAGCYIEADNPVAVASYLTGSAYSGLDYSLGDPAMTWVSSIEQSVNEIIIAPFIATGSSVLKEYYILIITPTFHKNLTEISIGNNDYEPISGGTWTDNVSGYSYYSLKLTEPNSTYRFMNTEGLTILGYGLGSAESYYYLAGSAARKLDASFYANGIHNQDLDGQEFCEGGDFIIKAVIKYKTHPDPGHLRWLINDVEELDVQDQIEWSKNLSAGDYTLSMIVKDQYSDVDTIKSSFSIFNITDVEINDLTICAGDTAVLNVENPESDVLYQWYDYENSTIIHTGPEYTIPDILEVGVHEYYVKATSPLLNCVSNRVKVNVTVKPLIMPDADNVIIKACYENPSVIFMEGLKTNYTYDLYADELMSNKLASVTGVESAAVNLNATPENNSIYISVVINDLLCSEKLVLKFEIQLIELSLSPEELPIYFNEELYSVQLTSNAVQPVYSYTGDLVTGVSISTDGLISGTVPEEAGVAPKTFTVTVTDENGCTAQREYTLKGCAAAPAVTPELVYCQYDQAPALSATPSEGMTLQWYAGDKTSKLDEAPVPNTDTPGEQVFYVAQINNDLNCEGIKAKITITVNPLPTLDFTATAPTICYQNSPTIELNELDASFVYDIYDDDKRTNKLASVTGVSGSTVNISEVLEVDKTYYISATSALGCASKDLKEVSVKLIKLNILPEQLPIYRKGVEYEQQLSSNAEFPVFTLFEGQLPLGLTINNSGTILGTVVWEENALSATFTVQVEDVNNCRATREYTLKKEMFVPKVFTPNNDGINDIFMLGYKVIIFDRMGITIFEGENGWDGSYKNNPASPDIYFYKLIYQNESGENMIKIGYIGLER